MDETIQLANAMLPGAAQIDYLRTSAAPGAVVMVNLLKFRPRAIYADGRETRLTGLEAFMLYSDKMKSIVESFNGRFLISAFLERLVIGDGDLPWDRIALVEYPSRAVFLQVMNAPQVQAAAVHRRAGLAGQLLIASTLQTDHR